MPFNLGLFEDANSTDDALALQLALSLLANLAAGNNNLVCAVYMCLFVFEHAGQSQMAH